jgi:hypothetical protein
VKIPEWKWLVGLGLVAVGLVTASQIVKRSTHHGPTVLPASRHELEAKAWQVLRDQFASPNSPQEPSWDKWWFTKCRVGLMDCDKAAKFSLPGAGELSFVTDQHKADPETLVNLAESIRVPVQTRIGERPPGSKAYAMFPQHQPAQLASVLFNETARNSLQNTIDKWNKGSLSNVAMLPGSMFAKAIWKAVPMNDKVAQDVVRFYIYPRRDPLEHDSADGNGSSLSPEWDFEKVTVDSSAGADDSACANPRKDDATPPKRHISPKCFHGYLLKANSKLLLQAEKLIAPPFNTDILYNACLDKPCYFILEGIHFMVRLGPGDPLYRDYAPWLFITFWWTGQDNKVFPEAPWKYYQMNVTQVARDDGRGGYPPNICFNPYLEGPLLNGAVSNCVSCHRFSRVMPSKNDISLMGTGVGRCLGSRPFPFSQTSACSTEEADYCGRGVQADFVWSLHNLNKQP